MVEYLEFEDIDYIEEIVLNETYDLTISDNSCYYLDCDKNILVHNSSKTWDTFHFLVLFCDHNRGKWNEIYILRDTLVNCRDFTLKEFIKCLSIIGVYDQKLLKTSPKPYYELFGNHIYFRGLDDEVNAEGYPSDIAFVNEALETTKGSVDGIKMRCRKLMIFDWNPKFIEHWTFKLEGQPNVFFTHTTYRNNKHLEESVRREIEAYEPTLENISNGTADAFRWKVYGQGLRAASEEVIFRTWDTYTESPEHYDLKVYGLDFGFTNDPTAVVEIYLTKKDIWVKELIYQTGLINHELAKLLKEKNIDKDIYVVCDYAEQKSITELRLAGINAIACVKGRDSVVNGIHKLLSKRMHVHKNSINLQKELRAYSYQKDRSGLVTNVPLDKNNHAIDATRYGATKFNY